MLCAERENVPVTVWHGWENPPTGAQDDLGRIIRELRYFRVSVAAISASCARSLRISTKAATYSNLIAATIPI